MEPIGGAAKPMAEVKAEWPGSGILDYRVNGRQKRYTIGKYPEWTATAARDEAATLKPRISKGYDPLEEKQKARGEPTLGDLATEYLERYASEKKRPSSLRNDRQMIDTIIRPQIGTLRLKAVGGRDIEALHASLKATPYRANRVLALLSSMFTKAAEWKWRGDNPAKGIQRFTEDRRERWLSAEEMHAFTGALDAYHDQNAADALRLLLLTGAREGEVLKADWTQFDLERGVWTKPSHHTKQKKIEHVPLSPQALDLLRAMKPKASGPLFPGGNKSKARAAVTEIKPKARVTIRRPWVQACKAAGLAQAITLKGKRRTITRYKPTVRIHDLSIVTRVTLSRMASRFR